MSDQNQRDVESFAAQPEDQHLFDRLEERLFLEGDWKALVALYSARLEAASLAENPTQRAELMFRKAQVIEERVLDPDTAMELYWEVAKLDPSNRSAMRQMRAIHASRGQWEMVLQISEIESQLPMKPYQKAAFLAEMGHVWLGELNDPAQSLTCFDQSLEIDDDQQDALTGRARALQGLERYVEAATSLEHLVEQQRGPDRAVTLVQLGHLLGGRLEDGERAAECFRRALTDDPRNHNAVDALAVNATAREQWPLLADLYERRFDLASGAKRRTLIALEAGHLQLDRLENTQAARMWFQRADELSPDEPAVQRAMADLERRAGNRGALRAALQKQIVLSEGRPTVATLLETAELCEDEGDRAGAREHLERAQNLEPENPKVLDALLRRLRGDGPKDALADALERRAALEVEPARQAELLVELAHTCDSIEDSERALDAHRRAFTASPATPGIAASLERVYRKQESWDDLRGLLESASMNGPENERPGYHCALGELLFEHFSEPDVAIAAFDEALVLEPDSPRALRGIAEVAAQSGDDDALLRATEREAAGTIDPDRLAFLVWELVRLLEARGRQVDALIWLERLVSVAPEDRRALQETARLQEATGATEALLPTLERLDHQLRGPEQAINRGRIAALHAAAGRRNEALECYEAALEIDPRALQIRETIVSLYEEAGEVTEAMRHHRRLVDLLDEPEKSRRLAAISITLEHELGDAEGAIVVLWQLVRSPHAPADTAPRLDSLLEQTGRFEELVERLREQRSALDETSEEGRALDARRGWLLLDRLAQYDAAAEIFAALRERDPANSDAQRGLEKALRASGDARGLVGLLEDRAREASSAKERCDAQLERASVLASSLDSPAAAVEIYRAIVDDESDEISAEQRHTAHAALQSLFESEGQWADLARLLERGLRNCASDAERVDLHMRLGALYRDRLAERERCIAHLEAATALRPGEAALWRNLVVLFHEEGQHEKLLAAIQGELAACQNEPERCASLHLRAARLCRDELDRRDGARNHYEFAHALEPGQSEAVEFLLEDYERNDDSEALVILLRERLDAVAARSVAEARGADSLAHDEVTALRLRIARLESDALDTPEAAIATLEAARSEHGAIALIAEPLCELYQRTENTQALCELCREASSLVEDSAERRTWTVRLADALRLRGEARDAIDAYRLALSLGPADAHVEAALRDLYREHDEPEGLAELLGSTLARPAACDADEALAMRMELATLLGDRLERPDEALDEIEKVLAADPHNPTAHAKALELCQCLERHERRAQLLDEGLAFAAGPIERAALHDARGDLLRDALERPLDAASAYRAALAEEPGRATALRSLRGVLEGLGHWLAVLDCIHVEARGCEGEARIELYERAVSLAQEHVSSDAALPWLERLRAEVPEDVGVIERITEVHRRAGRPEAVLRALDDRLQLVGGDDVRARELQLDRANVLERDLHVPAQAASALERARELGASGDALLGSLDRLYALLERPAERCEVLCARADSTNGSEAAAFLRSAASLQYSALCNSAASAELLQRALAQLPEDSPERVEILHEIATPLIAIGDHGLRARLGEEEILALPPEAAERSALRRELADLYAGPLANRDAARRHWLALLEEAPELPSALRHSTEDALIDTLRASRSHLALEAWLARSLEGRPDRAEQWLALGRLRDEQLAMPSAALVAYREVLDLEPSSLAAARGLRSVAERIGAWGAAIDALRAELAAAPDAPAAQRAGLQRCIGEHAWHRLGDTDLARKAYYAALDISPDDLASLRALETLCESRAEWRETVDLLERECKALGEDEPERRQTAWLQAGKVARDELDDTEGALEAYEAAAEASELDDDRTREWAELYSLTGAKERFVTTFGAWCDASATTPKAVDLLRLARALLELDRIEEARDRSRAACELEPGAPLAWDARAEYAEAVGENSEAADALAHAAELCDGRDAAQRWIDAAKLVDEDCPRALGYVRSACEHDAGWAEAAARRAILAERSEEWEEARTAARRALDLSPAGAPEPELAFASAMAGARSARERDEFGSAAGLYAAALDIDPVNAATLSAYGEVLHAAGETSAARPVLERRLAQDTPDPDKAKHLCIIAGAYELDGQDDIAAARLREAIAEDAACALAHASLARVETRRGNTDTAIAALDAWSESESEGPRRAAPLLEAARLALANGRSDDAELRLMSAVEEDAKLTEAWSLLAELQWEDGRRDDALSTARGGGEHARLPHCIARLARIEAQALEERSEGEAAAEAWGRTARNASNDCEAAIAQARLLRGLGRWDEAASALAAFSEAHPRPTDEDLGSVHFEHARMLAGPLEDLDGAIAGYRAALVCQPDHVEARSRLAGLLLHAPDRWREALSAYTSMIRANPCDDIHLRALARLATRKPESVAAQSGRIVLRALGIASPLESETLATRLPLSLGCSMATPGSEIGERLLSALRETASDLAGIVDATPSADAAPRDHAALLVAAEREATGLPISLLSADRIHEIARALWAAAVDPDADSNAEAARIGSALGRWTRRRLRKGLEPISPAELEAFDWAAWRDALRTHSAAQAIERGELDLRAALLQLIRDPQLANDEPETLYHGDDLDIRAHVSQSSAATALLNAVIEQWLVAIERER